MLKQNLRHPHTIFFIGWLMYFLYYLNRLNLPPVIPALRQDLNISHTQVGFFISLFMVIYTVVQLPAGLWGDRYGARKVVTLGCLVSSLANLAFSRSYNLSHLIVTQGINGFGQSLGFSPLYKLVVTWSSRSKRGIAIGFFLTSAPGGALFAYWFSGFLGNRFGWRSSFIIPPLIFLLGALVYWLIVRDQPEEEGVSPHENGVRLEQNSRPNNNRPNSRAMLVLSCRPLWIIFLFSFFIFYIWYSAITWLPSYFAETHGMDLEKVGLGAGVFLVGGLISRPFSGFLSDLVFLGRRKALMLSATLVLFAVTLLLWKMSNLVWIIILLGLLGFAVQFIDTLIYTYPADFLPPEVSSTGSGVLNTVIHISGILSTFISGWLVDIFHSFSPVFFSFLLMAFLGFFTALLIYDHPHKNSHSIDE